MTALYDDGLRRPGSAGPGMPAAVGAELHRRHQASELARDPTARAEVPLEVELRVDGWTVRLRGRADLVREADGGPVVEELKSFLPEAVATAAGPGYDDALPGGARLSRGAQQVRTYAWMLSRTREADGRALPVRCRLIWLPIHPEMAGDPGADAGEGEARSREIAYSAAETGRAIHAACARHVARARAQSQRAAERERLAGEIHWPRPDHRRGQGEIVRAVEQAVREGEQLLVHAPTGIGKTLAALVPGLRHALANDHRIFFATASGTGRRAARTAVAEILGTFGGGPGSPRATLIRARAAMCANDVLVCHDSVCSFAAGHADATRSGELVESCFSDGGVATSDGIRRRAQAAGACPFALSLDAADAGVVSIGDLNYAFDPDVRLWPPDDPALARTLVIADEVHQLAGRVRQSLGAALEAGELRRAAEASGFGGAPVHRAQQELLSDLAGFVEMLVAESTGLEPAGASAESLPPFELPVEIPADALAPWLLRFDQVALATLGYRAATGALGPDDPFLQVHRAVRRFARTLSGEAGRFATLAWGAPRAPAGSPLGGTGAGNPRAPALGLRRVCLDASPSLGRLLGSLHAFVGLSGSLAPIELHETELGLDPTRRAHIELPDPFPAECRRLVIDPRIDTRFERRAQSVPGIAVTLERLAQAVPAATLALLPSHALVAAVAGELAGTSVMVQRQHRDDGGAERGALIAALEQGRPGLTLAVAGGVLAESLDLPPGVLRCVAVVGPCLPAPSAEQALLEDHYEELCGTGFAWGRVAPGMRRVIQAAGRLVRRESDRGLLVLLGRRFLRDPYRAALPDAWLAGRSPEACVGDPVEEARAFFAAEASASGIAAPDAPPQRR